MDKKTIGAWIIHHGKKVAADQLGASEYSAIDIAAKATGLLARFAESEDTELSKAQVEAAAKVGGLNPKTELIACLDQLHSQKLIDRAKNGSVAVIGLSSGSALSHASDLFEANDPIPIERAAIDFAEKASIEPLEGEAAKEYLSDIHKIGSTDLLDFMDHSAQIGFVDAEGDGADRLYFNGNLFRRDTATKTRKVLDSLTIDEQRKLREFDEKMCRLGAVHGPQAIKVLGGELYDKLRAAGIYDVNVVSNEAGDHVFVTSPGAFNKFVNPLVDDAFDHAKALVSALSYGMSQSNLGRGRIWGVDLLLRKLIRGEEIGPATAIGNDYRALEFERVVSTRPGRYGFFLTLLKKEVGQLALEVLKGRNASATALENLPSAGMKSYIAPEANRIGCRKNQSKPSKAQTRSLLSAVRGGGSL